MTTALAHLPELFVLWAHEPQFCDPVDPQFEPGEFPVVVRA